METIFNRPLYKVLFGFVVLAVCLNFAVAGIWESFARIGIDFDAYYHWNQYLGTNSEKQVGIYPPSWWLFMIPFRLLSYSAAKTVWIILNLVCVLAIVWGGFYRIKRTRVWPSSGYYWLFGLLLISILYFYPLIVTLQTGQVNLILLFLLGLSFWYYLAQKYAIAGVLLGIATAMKAFPVLVIGYWLLKKEYKLVGIAISTVLLLWLLTIPIFGIQKQVLYFQSLFQIAQSSYANGLQSNNTSLYAFWSQTGNRLFPTIPQFGKTFFGLNILILLVAWIYTVYRTGLMPEPRFRLTLEYVWSVGTLPILLSFTEIHHFILLLLVYLVVVGFWFQIANQPAKLGLVVSWILVNLGYQICTVTVLPQSSYLYHYLSLFGILIGWVSVLIILFPKKHIANTANDTEVGG
ncbi:MAG: glycosyltransferase family 87 protein [bacterium]